MFSVGCKQAEVVQPGLGKLVAQNQGLSRTEIARCLLLLTPSERELGEDNTHLCQRVLWGGIVTHPPGRPRSSGQGSPGAAGVGAALLNLSLPQLRGTGPAAAAAPSAPQAGAAPAVIAHKGAEGAALGVFVCSGHSSPHTPRVVPDPRRPVALGHTGERSPEVPALGAVKLAAGVG